MQRAAAPASPSGTVPAETLWRRLRRNAGVILGGRVVFGLVNLAAAAVAVRAVGLEAFGVVALLQAYVRVVAGLLRFESWAAVTRFGAALIERGADADLRRLLGFTLRLDLIAFALSVGLAALAAPTVAGWFAWPPEVVALAPWYAVTIVFITAATPTGFLRLADRFRVLAGQHALNALIRLAGALALLAFGGGAAELGAVGAAAGILSGLWMRRAALLEARRRGLMPRMRGRWSELAAGFPRIWRFVAITNATAVVETVMSHLTVLIVGAVLGTTGASLYAVTRQLTDGLAKLSSLLGPIIFPEIAGLEARGERAGIRRLVRRTLTVSLVVLGAAMAVLAVVAEPLLAALFGPESRPAAALLMGAGAAASLQASGFALAPALLSIGREAAVFRTALVATLLFVPALLLLLDRVGLTGAGIALVLWQGTIVATRIRVLRSALRRPA